MKQLCAEKDSTKATDKTKTHLSNQHLNFKQQRSLADIGFAQFAPYLMNRIVGCWNNEQQEYLRAHNLNTAKMRTLGVLSVVSGLTINELSVHTVIEQSTMSRTLDTLENQSLIKRVSSKNDGRVRKIYITEQGKVIFERYWPSMFASYKDLFSGISDKEHEQFINTLNKMLRNIS